jgi:hypothetical protein
MKGSAFAWASSILENSISTLTFDSFKQIFNQRFTDVAANRKARSDIARLIQGTKPIDKFIEEFRSLEALTEYNDVALFDLFLKGLNFQLQKALSTVSGELSTFNKLVDKAAIMGRNMESFNLDFNITIRNQQSHKPSAGFEFLLWKLMHVLVWGVIWRRRVNGLLLLVSNAT